MTVSTSGLGIKNFTGLQEAGPEAVLELVSLARELKASPRTDRPLAGSSVALCFMNPSLRTQASFSVAAAALGAHPVALTFGAGSWSLEAEDGVVMDADRPEHAKDAARVLSRYFDAIALRSFPEGRNWERDRGEPHLSAFKRYSGVPVVNLESALGHPCQALADLMTMNELRPRARKFVLAWAPHIKALPLAVPHSAVEAAAIAGLDVTVLRPQGYDLDPGVLAGIDALCRRRGRRLEVTDSHDDALRGAHVVYAKSWGSLARYGEPPPSDADFRARWLVTAERMRQTEEAILLHCLPVRRNFEVADNALDGPFSAVIDEAENRLHTAQALLLALLEVK